MAVLKASEVFLRRQRKTVAKSMEGLFVVILEVELNHLRKNSVQIKFLEKQKIFLFDDIRMTLNEDGVLSVSWRIHAKMHSVSILPSKQALVDRNRFLVRSFLEEETALKWLVQQVSSCNAQLQDDRAESEDIRWVM